MEFRNRQNSHAVLLNLFACIAVVALSCALIAFAYFQYRAKEKEAESMKEFGNMASEMSKTLNQSRQEFEKEAQKAERQFSQPTPNSRPVSPSTDEPPLRLPPVALP